MSTTPPPTDDLVTLRQQVRAAHLRQKLARLDAESKLAEALWTGPGTGIGWSAWGHLWAQNGSSGTPPLIAGGRQAHQGGHNQPFAWSEVDLTLARGVARVLAAENPIAQGVLERLQDYTIRTGFVYEAQPEKIYAKDATALDCARELQRVIDEFVDLNEWSERERETLLGSVVDGEKFLRLFDQGDGVTLVRDVEPEQVGQAPGRDASTSYGIETDARDVEVKRVYHVTYDGLDFEPVSALEICHLKRNVPRTVKRGLPDFYSTSESFDGINKLLRAMRIGGTLQAGIPWIEKYSGASVNAVAAAIAGRRSLNVGQPLVDPVTGRSTSYVNLQAGQIPVIGEGKEHVPAPQAVNAQAHTAIVQACLRALGTRWAMPEYMISGDASNANYSSTLVSGSPFVTAIECRQKFYERYFLRVLWLVARNAANAGRFRSAGRMLSIEEVMLLCRIHVTPPKVAIANKREEFEVDKGLYDAGAMSIQTLRARHDLDDDQEEANLKERPRPQEPASQGGSEGAGPFFPPRLATG